MSAGVLVVVVNYRTAGLTLDCLRSLAAEAAAVPGLRAVVTDNASGDDSVDRIEAAIGDNGWSGWVSLMPLGHNGGFAFGNNAAIRPALAAPEPPRYILLLNPDTVVRPGAVAALVDFMDAHPGVGMAGSRLEDPDGTRQRSAFRFPTVPGELDGGMRLGAVSRLLARWVEPPDLGDDPRPVDWVAGASMIVRREVFADVGLLDEGYFMYFEEVDLCRRARDAGWPCWYVPASRVVHLVGQSSGVTDPRAPRRRLPEYWFASRRRYFRRTFGPAAAVLADLGWAAGYSTYRLRRVLQRKPDNDPERLLGDFLRYNFLRAGR